MDEDLIREAKKYADRRLQGEGRTGPLFGARFRVLGYDHYNAQAVCEAFRALSEYIAVLEARVDRLEKA